VGTAWESTKHEKYCLIIKIPVINCKVPWPTFGFQANLEAAYSHRKKTDRPKSKIFILDHRTKIHHIDR
jgi:hypothetical protein